MSDIKNLTKSQRKRRRQASGSPGTENGGHNTLVCNVDTPCVTNTDIDYYQLSDEYVRSVMNHNTSPTMNLEQQTTYGFQTPTSAQSPNVYKAGMSTPPSWALALIEDVKSIKESIPKIGSKIDLIDKSVNRMNTKLSDMESKVIIMENKITEIDRSVSFINDTVCMKRKNMNLNSQKKTWKG